MCHPKCKLDDLILVRLVIFNWFYLKRKISPSCNRILGLAFILNFSWQNAFLSGTINRQQIAHQFTKFYYPSLKSSIMELKNKKNPLVCRIFCDNNLRKALFCDNMMHLLYIWRSESNCLIYKNKKVNFLHLKIHASFCYFSYASCIFLSLGNSLVLTHLRPLTTYLIRISAGNAAGHGNFSELRIATGM